MHHSFILVNRGGGALDPVLEPDLLQLRSPDWMVVHVYKSGCALCDYILEVYTEDPATLFGEKGLIEMIKALGVEDVRYLSLDQELILDK